MIDRRVSWCFLVPLLLLAGCRTAPLGGTTWKVVEYYGPEEPRRQYFKEFVIEFRQDGRLVSTITAANGTVTIYDEDRYWTDPEDRVITVTTAEWEVAAMYRFEGKQLRVHSERFIVLMDPVAPGVEGDTKKGALR